MTGIIHLPTRSRRTRAVSRRALLAGTAGYAGAATFLPEILAQDSAPPGASPQTDEPGAGEARERMTSILAYAPPSHLGGPDPNTWLFSWLDLRAHLEGVGDPDPFAESTRIVAITAHLAVDDPLFVHAMQDELYELFGFSPLDVHQTLSTGAAPNMVTYYVGGVDTGALSAIWEAAGYEPKSGEAGEFWTIGEEGELDVQNRVQQMAFSRMNNLAILDDRVIVAAPTSALLNAVQVLVANGGESAVDDPGIATLIESMPENAVNVVAVPGDGLEAATITPEDPGMEEVNAKTESLLAESNDAAGPMPVSEMAFFGITTGVMGPEISAGDEGTPVPQGNPDEARFFVHLLMDSVADAEAAAEVVLWRFENMPSPVSGQMFAELFVPEFTPADAVQGEVAAMSFSNPVALVSWANVLFMQDLWPFVWEGTE